MDRELARKLLLLVNDKQVMDLLEAYVFHRIEKNRSDLETCSPQRLGDFQGAITELRRFRTLRNEVLKEAT